MSGPGRRGANRCPPVGYRHGSGYARQGPLDAAWRFLEVTLAAQRTLIGSHHPLREALNLPGKPSIIRQEKTMDPIPDTGTSKDIRNLLKSVFIPALPT